jgi:hypothetical protein
MDKTVAGLIGAISGLAALDAAQAAPIAGPNATGLAPAQSFAELLDPIPNAVAVLRAMEAVDAARVDEESPNAQLVGYHHHHRWRHHHHHHNRWWYHHHHHRFFRYHHHHHHHHRGY